MQRVADAFGLGAVRASAQVARGSMGAINRVETDLGTFAVKELFPWNEGAGVEAEVAFTARARAAGVLVPQELRALDGCLLVPVGASRFRVYAWFDLEPSRRTPEVVEEVGRLTAVLHGLATPADGPLHPWYCEPPDPTTWAALGLPELPGLATIRRSRAAPLMTCHTDLTPDNVLPFVGGGLAVLDWENLNPLELDQEVGIGLLTWCTDGGTVDPALVDAFLRGYGPVELDLSSFATIVTIWLNHLVAQASGARDGSAAREHVAFAEASVRRDLDAPLTRELVEELLGCARGRASSWT